MKRKIDICFYIILFTITNIFVCKSPILAETKEFNSNIDIEYLKKNKSSPYIIGPGDSLYIQVSINYPELSSNVTVSGEGNINVPTLGSIYVSGLTLSELKEVLDKALLKNVKFPDVQTSITQYRPVKVFVEGEVNSPGVQTLKGSMTLKRDNSIFIRDKTVGFSESSKEFEEFIKEEAMFKELSYYYPTVFDAIRSGGGITQFSDLSNVEVIRINSISKGGGKVKTTLNFTGLMDSNIGVSQNIRIFDGDIIRVKKSQSPNKEVLLSAIKSNLNPKYIKVFVTGKVNAPGAKVLSKSSTLNDAIDIAGGTKPLRGKVNYLTFVNDGSIEKKTINYKKRNKRGTKNNPYLKDGDLIFVGTGIFSNSASAITEITSPFQGIYSTYKLIELITD